MTKNRLDATHEASKIIRDGYWYDITRYKIDTYLGSGSIAIACHNLRYELTACELDKDYYDSAMKRLKEHKQQIRMF